MIRVDKIMSHPLFRNTLMEIDRCERDRVFCRHNIEHLLSVARIMLLLEKETGGQISQEVIYAAALLHDLGRVSQYQNGEDHARAGMDLSETILGEAGYTREERLDILEAIRTHNQQENNTGLGRLLKRADKLSRNCFLCPAREACYWPEPQKNQGVVV